jgi:uncharacterized protein with FMN-binding domain
MPTPRLHRGLVALSASAIAAVYMAGYLRTQSADASIGAPADSAPAVQSVAAAAGPPAVVSRVQPVAPPVQSNAPPAQSVAPPATARGAPPATPVPARTAPNPPAAAPAAQGAYKDGTYTGQGNSRRGGVVVNVVVQSGRIATVTITQSSLQYPLRDIAGLPAQVVQRQSAKVDTVSRATYSSQAFQGAVAQALSKAG